MIGRLLQLGLGDLLNKQLYPNKDISNGIKTTIGKLIIV